MVQIIFLGTSSMKPTKKRNHSGILLNYKSENILFDCGEGIQRQMKLAGIKPGKTTRLCVSHWHGDHALGIPGLISTMGADQFAKKLHIYGPKGSKKYMEYMLKAFFSSGVIDFEVHEITKSGTFFENDDFKLCAEPLEHSARCIGFSFIEKEKLRINVAKAKKLGLKEGPELGKLQKGKNIVHKGKKILFEDVTYPIEAKKFSYVSDTIVCDGAYKLAENTDLLVIESSFHHDDVKKAKQYYHLTARQAALIANESGAKKLILTHPSSRYKKVSVLVEEALQYFPEVTFAEDFMKINF